MVTPIMGLDGKVALITGAASGQGRVAAQDFGRSADTGRATAH